MKILCFIALFASLAHSALADAPKQPNLSRYSRLWTDSPFTSKPVKEGPAAAANPLEDYSLGGISRLSDGYFAILLNRKDPKDRQVVSPGSKSDFEIVKVDWSDSSWKETVVTLRKGGVTGTVTFEDKLIAIKAPVVKKKPTPTKPAQIKPPSGKTGGGSGGRTPRPRVVVPPKR